MSEEYEPKKNDLGGLMAHLGEELAEAQAALMKSMRWGLSSVNPELPEAEQETNLAWLRREMDDVVRAWSRLEWNLSELAPWPTLEAEPRFQDRRRLYDMTGKPMKDHEFISLLVESGDTEADIRLSQWNEGDWAGALEDLE